MAFDGITIANIAQELNQTIVGGKINKIAQPEKCGSPRLGAEGESC